MKEDEKLRKDIQQIKEDVNTVITILKGPKKTDKPTGLIYRVSQNTKFRSFLIKAFWIILPAIAGLIVWLSNL